VLAADAFAGTRTVGYLDTATYGLPPKEAVLAVEEALRGWREWENWSRWEADGEACRRLFAGIVGARAEEVALVSAVSVAAGIVAASLAARPGDNIVAYEHEFQSALFPWLLLERRGIEVRLRGLDDLAGSVDARTRLVAVSTVQSADGRVADLDALRETGAPVFLDATQAAGALPIELDGVDFLAAGAYKWLLCPRGLAFLYVRGDRLPQVEPLLAGWKSIEDVYERYYGLPMTLTEGARRLDTSLPWFLAAGARPSLELIAELGPERIAAHDLALAARFCAGLEIPETGSPIVQVAVADSDVAVDRLRSAGIKCAARAGALRFAFHLYNDETDADRAIEILEAGP
jgi:selenocysteine lyase/cysteine desulfurase